jgi:hypothetical protein
VSSAFDGARGLKARSILDASNRAGLQPLSWLRMKPGELPQAEIGRTVGAAGDGPREKGARGVSRRCAASGFVMCHRAAAQQCVVRATARLVMADTPTTRVPATSSLTRRATFSSLRFGGIWFVAKQRKESPTR